MSLQRLLGLNTRVRGVCRIIRDGSSATLVARRGEHTHYTVRPINPFRSIIQRAERADSLGMAGGLGHGLGLPFGENAWLTFLTFDLLIKIVIFASVSMPNILLVLRL